MSSESTPLQKEEETSSQSYILTNITLIARLFGVITVAVMWIATILIIKDHSKSYVGYYFIVASILVKFFELTWILDKSARCVRQGCCCRIWSYIMWVDNWKKFILYFTLSIPLFLDENRLSLSVISGLLLIILSTLYLIKTFQSNVFVRVISTQTDTEHTMTSNTVNSSEISKDEGAHKSK
ncbi:uncharacterized protein LOC131942714 isoform X3 [Physella acuta]|uniref:uncharacterized protein LOC131942714 isoform X3 n=1 Tax=Physella acuta TaxID=109671 RepID=UPI0027DE56A2|nr:uncharacterized protein LOC131942714 isoform X3 [Physella acuta]